MPDGSSAITNDVIAVATERNAGDLVVAICTERLAFLQGLKIFPVFGRGWTTRVNGVRAAALAMAKSQPLASVVSAPTKASPGKAIVPVKNPAGPASAGAVIAAGAASAAATSRLQVALMVAATAALAAILIFFIWRWRHRAEQEAAAMPSPERTSNGLG